MRAEGIVGDVGRSLVKRQILCVNEPVGVGTADGGLGRGWCGSAAGRGEEAGACAAEVGDDVVDDGVVSEGQDAQFARACRTGQGVDLEHTPEQFRPGESACVGGRGVVAWGLLVGCGVGVGGEPLTSGAAGTGSIGSVISQLMLAGMGDARCGASEKVERVKGEHLRAIVKGVCVEDLCLGGIAGAGVGDWGSEQVAEHTLSAVLGSSGSTRTAVCAEKPECFQECMASTRAGVIVW